MAEHASLADVSLGAAVKAEMKEMKEGVGIGRCVLQAGQLSVNSVFWRD